MKEERRNTLIRKFERFGTEELDILSQKLQEFKEESGKEQYRIYHNYEVYKNKAWNNGIVEIKARAGDSLKEFSLYIKGVLWSNDTLENAMRRELGYPREWKTFKLGFCGGEGWLLPALLVQEQEKSIQWQEYLEKGKEFYIGTKRFCMIEDNLAIPVFKDGITDELKWYQGNINTQGPFGNIITQGPFDTILRGWYYDLLLDNRDKILRIMDELEEKEKDDDRKSDFSH